jgi:uncharacterized phiE125 gp8 family phage protein
VGLIRVTAPANLPVTLTEAKAHIDVEHSEHDALITMFLQAATDHVDGPRGFLGRALVDQTWDYYTDAFPNDCDPNLYLHLPLPPLIEVVGVYYTDTAGDEQTVDAATYTVDLANSRVALVPNGSWPTAGSYLNAVRVRFRAGYITTDSPPDDDVPPAIKAGILLMVGNLYRNREAAVVGQTVATLPYGAEALLRPYRYHLSLA